MSIETWKKEFYPVPASKVSKEDAAYHSFRKWLGMLPANIEKHSLTMTNVLLVTDGLTCALCARFYSHDEAEHPCNKCPLNTLTGHCGSWLNPYGDALHNLEHWFRDKTKSDRIAATEAVLKMVMALAKAVLVDAGVSAEEISKWGPNE